MTSRKMILVCIVAAIAVGVVYADATGRVPPDAKKIVLYGWDTGEASLETVLSNADKFAATTREAADAVELCLDEGVIAARNKLNARPRQAPEANEPQVDEATHSEEA